MRTYLKRCDVIGCKVIDDADAIGWTTTEFERGMGNRYEVCPEHSPKVKRSEHDKER